MFPTHVPKYIFALPVLVAVIGISVFVSSSRVSKHETSEVRRADISQEVLASGNVASPNTIDLQFQGTGRLSQVSVQTGDVVQKGQILASLDTSVLSAQREQAVSVLAAEKAKLATLQIGTRPEELAVTEAQVALDTTALSQAQQGVINAIQNAYTVSDSAVKNTVDQLFENPITNPSLKFNTIDTNLKGSVEAERSHIGLTLATWQQNAVSLTVQGNLSAAENLAQNNLQEVSKLLSDANDALSLSLTNASASSAQVNSWMTNVASARSSVNAAISTLTAAVTARTSAAAQLEREKKTLLLQQAGATQSQLDAQAAQVLAAQANVSAIEAQIAQMHIVAPLSGTVTQVNVETGETVTPGALAISMIPESKLQIDVNLSEENVADAEVGDAARIMLDAFGNGTEWQGTVTKIDPAQTIIGGAVYYKTTVNFDRSDERVKPGMTANIWIKTGTASSTLVVPASALRTDASGSYVEALHGNALQRISVKTGLKSRDGNVEIFGAINEGERVVIGER